MKLIAFIVLFITLFVQGVSAADVNLSNNVDFIQIEVKNTNEPDVVIVPIKYFFEEYNFTHYSQEIQKQQEFLKKTYPIKAENYSAIVKNRAHSAINIENNSALTNLLIAMYVKTLLFLEGTEYDRLALAYQNGFSNVSGSFYNGSSIMNDVVVIQNDVEIVLAHEITHSYGMDHLNCSGVGCYLNSTTENLVGFLNLSGNGIDSYELMMKNGATNSPHWISKESYLTIISGLENNPPVFSINGSSRMILVEYNESRTKKTKILKSYESTGGISNCMNESYSTSTNYTLITKNQNTVVNECSYNPELTEVLLGEGGGQILNYSLLVFIVPNDNVTSIILEVNETVDDFLNASENDPLVLLNVFLSNSNFTTPFNVTWNASDADNDSLLFALLISDDAGSSWTTIDFDINEMYYTLDNADFAYGTDYRVRVLATDGFNTGTAEMNESFTIIPPPSTDAYALEEIASFRGYKLLEGRILNDGGHINTNSSWTLNTGFENVSGTNTSLSQNEDVFIIFEHNYSTGGTQNITLFSEDNQLNISDSIMNTILLGSLRIQNINELYAYEQRTIVTFNITNTESIQLTNNTWNMNTGEQIINSQPYNITENESIIVIIEHTHGGYNTYATTISANDTQYWHANTYQANTKELALSTLTNISTNGTITIYEVTTQNRYPTNKTYDWTLTTNGTSQNITNQYTTTLQPANTTYHIIAYDHEQNGTYETLFTANTTNANYSATN